MSHKKKIHPLSPQPISSSVELIPLPPKFTEFIDAHRIWGFSSHELSHFVLEDNPEHHGKRTLPAHQLILLYPDAVVILKGWRLELLVGQLVSGRVARVHAEKSPGPLIVQEARVSEICVLPFIHISLLKNKPETQEKS